MRLDYLKDPFETCRTSKNRRNSSPYCQISGRSCTLINSELSFMTVNFTHYIITKCKGQVLIRCHFKNMVKMKRMILSDFYVYKSFTCHSFFVIHIKVVLVLNKVAWAEQESVHTTLRSTRTTLHNIIWVMYFSLISPCPVCLLLVSIPKIMQFCNI